MLKQLFLLLFSTSLLLSSLQPCNLDLTPNTAELLCEDETLNLFVEYDQGANAKGKLTKISDVSGSVELAYDAKGNIASKTQTITSIPSTSSGTDSVTEFTTGYTYNEQDKLSTQTYPSGKVISYVYDAKGELVSISIDGNDYITNIQTNQNGLLSYTYSDGTTHTREYDTNGRVTKLIYPDYTEVVNYNEVSNITSITADDKTKHFDYDAIDRLVSYDLNATEYQRFTYDANGNRLSQNQEVNRSQSYIYTNNTNILEQVIHTLRVDENTTQTEKEVTYTYDKTGNIIQDDKHTYVYDSRNRLTKVDDNITYQYNYDNRRVSKTVNNTTTYYLYEAHKLVGEYDENGDVIKEYLYYGDTPLAVITNTDTHKIYADHLDTPRRVATQDNSIVWIWESKPFGEDKPTGSYTLNLRFPGQYFDAETQTHYNINRDYNPVTGRYVQSDPIGFDGGSNTFLYANGNGVRFVDENGLFFDELVAVGAGVVSVTEFAIATVGTIASLLSGDTRENDELPVIYYHYTNKTNFNMILSNQKIIRGSKGLVYVSPCRKSPKEVENDLFIGQKPGFGDYVIAFRPKVGVQFTPDRVNICELTHVGSLNFTSHIRVIYAGKNKF